ncbi:MAG: hypothetical protein Q8M97_00400 [Methanobacteriaceae archaeon]|nr:hypothetical protein [Methanobacteriaceae archaeon]
MGLTERIERSIEERERRYYQEMLDLFDLLYGWDVPGLAEVLDGIKELCRSGLYAELIRATDVDKSGMVDGGVPTDVYNYRLISLAKDNLGMGGLLYTVFSKSDFFVKDFFTIYMFIESVYYLHKNNIGEDDLMNIYFSGLDERIIFALDDFDVVSFEELPEPTSEHIKTLKKVKWENKELYKKMKRLMMYMMMFSLGFDNKWDNSYGASEDIFICLIAAFSALADGRMFIGLDDTVRAYRTLLKLINTDVTGYKALPELINWDK